jgi:hypothetical protein
MDTSANMSGFVQDVARSAWPFAITIIVIAVISTAFVQMIKDLLPLRRWFQRWFVLKWLNGRVAESSQRQTTTPVFAQAEKDLIHLATGGDVAAFYNLEVEQLCGQMNSAAQIALAYAARHEGLLFYLAPDADPADIQTMVSASVIAVSDRAQPTPEQGKAMTALLDARNRVAHHLQRGIDALQISMGSRWKLILQIVVYIICFGVAFAGVFWIDAAGGHKVFDAIIIGILAGFVSPIVRDLMAVLDRLRNP